MVVLVFGVLLVGLVVVAEVEVDEEFEMVICWVVLQVVPLTLPLALIVRVKVP
jgi:hypothetical protein